MALEVGSQLGHYDVSALIGEGGMGQVYQATDTTLNRQVELKILPEAFAADPDRLARFQREAQVLASLNHPGIAAIYGLEVAEPSAPSGQTTRALVLELVEGPTLADRIRHGPIPLDEALPIATQIATALEAAHEAGIIHRDLKPANIKVRDDGTVKILDFGLAKAVAGDGASSDPGGSPTITTMATATGVILGTAAYMSPEQMKGKKVDRRADIWAFGCVLYEMLTGQRAFAAEDVSETLAAVLTTDVDLDRLPTEVPARLRQVLITCLRKNPKERARDIGDVGLAMEGAFETTAIAASPEPATAQATGWRRALLQPVVLGALTVGVLIGAFVFRSTSPPPSTDVTRSTLDTYPGTHLGVTASDGPLTRGRPTLRAMTFSPDGRSIVYVARSSEDTVAGFSSQLYLRRLDQERGVPMPGTEGAWSPFFSPDGESVGFFAAGQLMRVSVGSGEVRTVSTGGPRYAPVGAVWTLDDTILLASQDGLLQVAAAGGTLQQVTERTEGDPGHNHPEVLPGGRAILFGEAKTSIPSEWDIVAQSLDTDERVVVVEGGSDPTYVPSGHIVFARDGALMAVPFDPTSLRVSGDPVVVIEDVMQAERGGNSMFNTGDAQFSVSSSGSLAYVPGGPFPRDAHLLNWVDLEGDPEPIPLPPATYLWPRVSPDGTRLAYAEGVFGDRQIWVYDLALNVPVRLTSRGYNSEGVWSPDGERIVFASSPNGRDPVNLYSTAADGSGDPERLTESNQAQRPASWSSTGVLAFLQSNPDTGRDILTLVMDGESEPEVFVGTPSDEFFPAFSPDGRWLAYSSNETDRPEVYVRPFPEAEPAYRVSTDGGGSSLWSRDGRQLFYLAAGDEGKRKVMVVDVSRGPTFVRSSPRLLFEREFSTTVPIRGYDITPDGQRFVITIRQPFESETVTRINVVQNWVAELKARVPTE